MSHGRWEYKVVPAPQTAWGTRKPEQITEALNREGNQGWELVNAIQQGTQLHLYMKRPR